MELGAVSAVPVAPPIAPLRPAAEPNTAAAPAAATSLTAKPAALKSPALLAPGVALSAQSTAQQPDASQNAAKDSKGPSEQLTPEEQDQVDKLKDRDSEVRAHEQAHQRVGGQYAGSPSYTYQTGPDGKQYAVGGEVAIDASPIPGDPQATIDKAQQVKAAALAPAEPSSQDRKVAAEADAMKLQAQADLIELKAQEAEQGGAPGTPRDPLTTATSATAPPGGFVDLAA